MATISPGSLQTNTQESPADIWMLILIHHHHHHHHHPHHHRQEHHQDQHHLHQHTWDRDEVPAVIGKCESSDELWVASHGGHAFSSVVIVDGLMGRGVLVNNWEKLSFEEEKDSGDALSKLNRLEMKRVVCCSVGVMWEVYKRKLWLWRRETVSWDELYGLDMTMLRWTLSVHALKPCKALLMSRHVHKHERRFKRERSRMVVMMNWRCCCWWWWRWQWRCWFWWLPESCLCMKSHNRCHFYPAPPWT